ncbi:hypothetical protein GALMADRAFT_211583 [Galerina marginata CBS 339.88]|uniref:Uncharacterized protein n=1 Tax=Galerina marginata (strain CBS 339.88) TaxID=685588 RepID=A0A067SWU2_GALM3|nr:hypothetical protein GALMADRAFT_211583 [Galerina marginata CBS 339.88]
MSVHPTSFSRCHIVNLPQTRMPGTCWIFYDSNKKSAIRLTILTRGPVNRKLAIRFTVDAMDPSQDAEPSKTRRIAGYYKPHLRANPYLMHKLAPNTTSAGSDGSISTAGAKVGNLMATRDKRAMHVKIDQDMDEVAEPSIALSIANTPSVANELQSSSSISIADTPMIANEIEPIPSPATVNSTRDDSGSATADGSGSENGIDSHEAPKNYKGKQKSAAKIAWNHSSDEAPPKPLMDKMLQEVDLIDSYANLPILQPAQLKPFNKEETLQGFFKFKLWRKILFNGPDTSERIKEAILFDIKGNTFNPARADPAVVAVAAIGNPGSRFIVSPSQTNSCMLALTTGCSKAAELVHGRVNTFNAEKNTISKRICIIPHSQEFERFVGFVGMAFNMQEIKAHCFSDYTLTMSTRTASLDAPVPRVTNLKFQNFLNRHLSSDVKSPALSRSGGNSIFVRTSLSPHENVPVYDARRSDFTLQDDLSDVTGLPLYEGGKRDLPDGSCVTIAHTIGIFKNKDNEEILTLNIHWAILWGVPNTSTF